MTDPLGRAAPPLEAVDVHKRYPGPAGGTLEVLRGISLTVEAGEAVAIIGASGAGKSTLLHIIGALDLPTEGDVRLGGTSIAGLAPTELAAVRNRHVGFVFQFHHLLKEFTALENVMMPRLIAGGRPADERAVARGLLAAVGLESRVDHKPTEMSGGEQQRVAVARALANDPLLLLADEPSGNLDHHTSQSLHDLLFDIREQRGTSMVLVTHNLELADRADRVLHLTEGGLESA
ncbi:ABC transporter ATP-binding protein [Gaopeijia maritima]|uniref:ABC transporter ATP-binding protein n=1 Tax=Gaopeijia maritima TaxID=3119007 RepID=UPI00324AD20B